MIVVGGGMQVDVANKASQPDAVPSVVSQTLLTFKTIRLHEHHHV
jgi:hypothetical protein